jgi:D-sedoheptulose 7-phosphate isomerase
MTTTKHPDQPAAALTWVRAYLQPYHALIEADDALAAVPQLRDLALNARGRGGKLIFAGNGASASIAGHLANDFSKQAHVPAVTFHDPAVITALANDYGYEQWLCKALEFHLDPADVVILISSSGRSPNILRAAEFAKQRGVPLVTFTGFAPDNPLKRLGDLNFWVDSRAYNLIECVHMIWLTAVVDLIIGRAEYAVS